MTDLFAVELRRLASRRLVKFLAIFFVGVFLVVGVNVYAQSEDSSDLAGQRRLLIDECTSRRFGPPERICLREAELTISNNTFDLVELEDAVKAGSGFLVIAALIVGASFIGAEWQRGTIATTLTWEPRRDRVFVAKVLAVAVGVFLGTILLLAVLSAVLLPTALTKGSTLGADWAWFWDMAGGALRGTTLASLGAVMGLSIAMIGRSTSAALGAAFVYLAIAEGVIRGWRPGWARWLVGDNGAKFVAGTDQEAELAGRSAAEAGLLLLVYVAVIALVASGFFRRRDVT